MPERTDLTKVDIRLAVTDSPVEAEPYMTTCRNPSHKDDTFSLAVYPGHLNCYGCGFRIARRMEALAYLLGIPLSEVFKVASKYTVDHLDTYRERAADDARKNPLPVALAESYHQLLRTTRRGRAWWLVERGLSVSTIVRAKLGHDSTRFTVPFFDKDGKLLTVRFRQDPAFGTEYFDPYQGRMIQYPKYSGIKHRNGLLLFPENLIAPTQRPFLVVVEGEFDALRLWQEDIPAVTITNGAGNLRHLPRLVRELFPWVEHLYIAPDMDVPGSAAAYRCAVEAKAEGFTSQIGSWNPAWGKDVSELYQRGHTLKEVEWYGTVRLQSHDSDRAREVPFAA